MFGSMNPTQYKVVTANTLVKKSTGLCTVTGLLCSSSTSMVVQIWDTATDETNASAVKVVDSLTLVAGTPYPIPAKLNNGLYIKLISGTGSLTVFFD